MRTPCPDARGQGACLRGIAAARVPDFIAVQPDGRAANPPVAMTVGGLPTRDKDGTSFHDCDGVMIADSGIGGAARTQPAERPPPMT